MKRPTTSALELDIPDARGRSLANAMSAPRNGPGKFCARRDATVCAYTVQPVADGTRPASSDTSPVRPRPASAIRTVRSERGAALTQNPRPIAQSRLRPPP